MGAEHAIAVIGRIMAGPRRRESGPRAGLGGNLGRRFVERRIQLGLTQANLADLAGVSRSTVQMIESGAGSAKLELCLAVAEALGCDLLLTTKSGDVV